MWVAYRDFIGDFCILGKTDTNFDIQKGSFLKGFDFSHDFDSTGSQLLSFF